MDKQALEKALNAYNTNPKDDSAVGALGRLLGPLSVIHLTADGKIDVNETIESAEFAVANGLPGEHKCLSVAALAAKAVPATPTDPISGLPLRKGKTTISPVVDWSPVPEPRRFTAAYAAETNQLPFGGSEMAAFHLQQGTLQPPWNRLDTEAQELLELEKDRVKAPRAKLDLIDRVRARLYRSSPGPAAPILPAAPVPPAADPAEDPNPVLQVAAGPDSSSRSSGPRIFILAHDRDRGFEDELVRHLHPLRGTRTSSLRVPQTQDPAAYIRGQMRAADIIVAVTSADLLADPQCYQFLEEARQEGRPIAPWVVRACVWSDSVLSGCNPIGGTRNPTAYAVTVALSNMFRGR